MGGLDGADMERALKERCVPVLRRAGFRGSFPDFYRDTEGFVALVNVQVYSAGGSFCVNRRCAGRQVVLLRTHKLW
jgi:hypothetical protein